MRLFNANEIADMGTVVWNECLTQWKPKRNDCYAHFVGVISTGKSFKAIKRHYKAGGYGFEILDSFSTKDEAIYMLELNFS
jgi:hypothetical protein